MSEERRTPRGDLRAQPIARATLGQVAREDALGTRCLPWYRADDALVCLHPSGWSEARRAEAAQVLAARVRGDVTLRDSGRPQDEVMRAIDFHYRRLGADVSCTTQLELECPMRWDALELTVDPEVRFCHACQRGVHLVANQREFENRAEAGDCVAFVRALGAFDEDSFQLGVGLDPEYSGLGGPLPGGLSLDDSHVMLGQPTYTPPDPPAPAREPLLRRVTGALRRLLGGEGG